LPDFVHLHLIPSIRLLDGACRIDDCSTGCQVEMPAVAVTEHGNLFSSVIFHDHRERGD